MGRSLTKGSHSFPEGRSGESEEGLLRKVTLGPGGLGGSNGGSFWWQNGEDMEKNFYILPDVGMSRKT
jgi:hypothetical protein